MLQNIIKNIKRENGKKVVDNLENDQYGFQKQKKKKHVKL